MDTPNKIWVHMFQLGRPHSPDGFAYTEVTKEELHTPYYHIPDELVESIRESGIYASPWSHDLLAIIDGAINEVQTPDSGPLQQDVEDTNS